MKPFLDPIVFDHSTLNVTTYVDPPPPQPRKLLIVFHIKLNFDMNIIRQTA